MFFVTVLHDGFGDDSLTVGVSCVDEMELCDTSDDGDC